MKGSQATNIISAIFALLGIVAFIIDLNFNGLYRSSDDYYSYLVLVGGGTAPLSLLASSVPGSTSLALLGSWLYWGSHHPVGTVPLPDLHWARAVGDDSCPACAQFCLSFGKAELQRTKSKTRGWWEMGKAISAWGMPSTGHC